ncbi:hypothetical protein D3C75_1367790 [compost metagenome]
MRQLPDGSHVARRDFQVMGRVRQRLWQRHDAVDHRESGIDAVLMHYLIVF